MHDNQYKRLNREAFILPAKWRTLGLVVAMWVEVERMLMMNYRWLLPLALHSRGSWRVHICKKVHKPYHHQGTKGKLLEDVFIDE